MNEAAIEDMASYLCPGQEGNASSWYSVSVCRADYVSCIPHLGFILLTSILLLVYGCFPRLRRDKTPYTLHYPCHHTRWLLLFTLLFALTFFFLEGVLSDFKSPRSQTQPHLYLPASCAFLAVALACVYYHHAEAWLRPGFAWLLLAYWGLALAGEGFRLASWMEDLDNVDVRIVRFDAIVFMVSTYAVLFLVELCAMIVMMFLRRSIHKSLPDDLLKPDMKYYMRYVSFPSLIFFTWPGWLLRVGYQHPLEISDLGSLPEMSTSRSNEKKL